MGLLKGSSVYLIGSIDHAEDPRKWRKQLTNDVLTPLGVKVYDPLVKPAWFSNDKAWYGTFKSSYDEISFFKSYLRDPETEIPNHDKANGWAKMKHHLVTHRMQEIRKLCLSMVNSADFIIGKLPKQFTVGTLEELTIAANAGKPILLCLPDGMDTSTWLPAQVGNSFWSNSFSTMEELSSKIMSIDAGDADVDNYEWIFLSYFNDEDVINEFSNHQQT